MQGALRFRVCFPLCPPIIAAVFSTLALAFKAREGDVHKAIVALCLSAPVVAWGQAELLEPPTSSVYALQDRAYRLQNEFTVLVGVLPSDPYTKGIYAQGGYAFHFNDYFGIQARGAYSIPLSSKLREQLERDFTVLPTLFPHVLFFVGGDLIFRPLYGKLSFLNRFVIHGEIHLLGGGSAFGYTDGVTPSLRPALDEAMRKMSGARSKRKRRARKVFLAHGCGRRRTSGRRSSTGVTCATCSGCTSTGSG